MAQVNDGAKIYAQGMTYAALGGLAQVQLGNGLMETTGYNHRGQVSKSEAKAGTVVRFSSELGYADPVAGIYNNGNVLWQRTQRGANTWRQGYQYDGLNRLKQVSETQMNNEGSSAWQRDYAFNRWGNMWVSGNSSGAPGVYSFTPQAESNFDALNRLHIQLADYDAAGNQKEIGGFTFAFDGENRMVSSTLLGNTATYAYDGEGRRVQKGATVFVYDAFGKLAAEYGGTTTATGTQYLTGDHLGSTRLVTNATGAEVTCYDYEPFGQQLVSGLNGRPACFGSDPSADPQKVRFTGKERDAETAGSASQGLDYFLARYYSGAQGRFAGVDPENVGSDPYDPQSWNGYAYSRNNPLLYTDPDGRDYRVCQLGNNGGEYNCGTVQDDRAFEDYARSLGWSRQGNNLVDQNGQLVGTAYWFDGESMRALIRGTQTAEPVVKAAGIGTALVMAGAFGGMAYGAWAGGSALAPGWFNALQGHHAIPRFLGGNLRQALSSIPRGVHQQFHALLRQELKKAGIPLNVGGRGGSIADWANYMRANPGAQKAAFEAVLRAAKAIDAKFGTQLAQDFAKNVAAGAFK